MSAFREGGLELAAADAAAKRIGLDLPKLAIGSPGEGRVLLYDARVLLCDATVHAVEFWQFEMILNSVIAA